MALVIAHTFAQIKQLIMKKILSFLSVVVATASFSQLSVDALSTNYTIDFDATVAGVNNGQFQGAGFDPAPGAGLLDSDAWSMDGFEQMYNLEVLKQQVILPEVLVLETRALEEFGLLLLELEIMH
jgi:hypothetical protein